jgi:hypothetical protein
MPPVIPSENIPGLEGSSLFLDKREDVSSIEIRGSNGHSASSPMEIFKTLTARSANPPPVAGTGAVNPSNINMQGLMAGFAIIGASFVLAAIWFFFWAKNGGFVWRKGDWEDYKSTVLRRKGPDGRTLSNATKSTKLGGGSVVPPGYSDDGYTVTDVTETATTVTEEKPKRKNKFKQTAKEKLLGRRKDEKWEGERDNDVRAYRHEKPARVGGINREPDGTGTYYGSDYTTSDPPTAYNESEAHNGHGHGHQRNVSGFSFTAGSEDVLSQTTEEHQLRNPSSRRDQGRQNGGGRRSRQGSPRKRERSSMPGGYTEPLDFSSRSSNSEYQYAAVETGHEGTKSYNHPIPGLSKGYRRDGGRSRRRDSLSDSEG